MNNSLLLFPQSEQTILKSRAEKLKILKYLQFNLKQIIRVINLFFFEKKYHEFDPHVGDTLCQIRAYELIIMASNKKRRIDQVESDLNDIKKLLSLLESSINNFIKLMSECGEYNQGLDRKECLSDFIKRYGMFFDISDDILFLFQTYMLSKFSKVDFCGISRGVDYAKFCEKAEITKSFAKRIMHYYQQKISERSCRFVSQILDDLKHFSKLKYFLPKLMLIDADGRCVLPCYEVTKILLAHLLKNRFGILVVIEHKYDSDQKTHQFLFNPNFDGTDFELASEIYDSEYNEPYFTIKGVTLEKNICNNNRSSFLQRLTKLGLTTTLLANMAQHPQYSAVEFENICENPYYELLTKKDTSTYYRGRSIIAELESEYLIMKKLARQEGCCLETPTLFSVKHILCDTIHHQNLGWRNIENQRYNRLRDGVYISNKDSQSNMLTI